LALDGWAVVETRQWGGQLGREGKGEGSTAGTRWWVSVADGGSQQERERQ